MKMTMRTRSKVGHENTATGGKQESDPLQVIDTGQETSQRAAQVEVTDIAGVKIKKELIEENLPVGLTETGKFTDEAEVLLVNNTNGTYGSHRNEIDGLQKLVKKNVRRTYVLGDRRSLVPTHGKRRLPSVSTRKKNKKYFQDIRQFAITSGLDRPQSKSLAINGDTANVGDNTPSKVRRTQTETVNQKKNNKKTDVSTTTHEDEQAQLKVQEDVNGLATAYSYKDVTTTDHSDGSESDSSLYSAAFDGYEDGVLDLTRSSITARENSVESGDSEYSSAVVGGENTCSMDIDQVAVDVRAKDFNCTASDSESASFNVSDEDNSDYSASFGGDDDSSTDADTGDENKSVQDTECKASISDPPEPNGDADRVDEPTPLDGDDENSMDVSDANVNGLDSLNSTRENPSNNDHSSYTAVEVVQGVSPRGSEDENCDSVNSLINREAPVKQVNHQTYGNLPATGELTHLKNIRHQNTVLESLTSDSSTQPNELNDSDMIDAQCDRTSNNAQKANKQIIPSTVKVRFDEETKENTQSSLRRHKKNNNTIPNNDRHIKTDLSQSFYPTPRPIQPKFTVIAKSKSAIDQQMKLRGANMVEEKKLWETPVKLEFNIDRATVEYNVRAQLLLLLKLMKLKDPTLKVKSTTDDNKIWGQLDTLPEDSDFNDNFQIKDFLYRKMRKVVVYMKLLTSLHVNQIKYTDKVKQHLFQHNIWFKPDMFQTKVESSPGVMIMLHPKLTHRSQLTEDLKVIMQSTAKTLDLNSKNKAPKDAGEKDENFNRQVPQFYLELSVKKWRDLRVEVIRINCAKEDAEYIKFLLSSSGEQGSLRKGVFLPEGLHLMEGTELVYNMLQEHGQFIGEVTGIPVSGINFRDLSSVVPQKNKTIKELIMNIPGVICIEQTRARDSPGTLLVLTTKSKEQNVTEKLAQQMELLYACQTGQKRIILAGRQKVQYSGDQSNSVKTYAEILSARFQPTEQVAKTLPSSPQQKEIRQTRRRAEKTQEISNQTHTEAQRSRNDSPLVKRLEEMAAAQEKIEQAHHKLQQEHNKLKKAENIKYERADTNKQEDKLNQMMDRKLADFREENRQHMEEHDAALRKEIGRSFDNQMDRISITVANQVTSQLVELFQQYMLPKKQIESSGQTREKQTPLITQESFTTTPEKKLQDSTFDNHKEKLFTPGDSSMLQAINAIDTTPTPPRSPHDKITERTNTL